jgi:hypothetical protein
MGLIDLYSMACVSLNHCSRATRVLYYVMILAVPLTIWGFLLARLSAAAMLFGACLTNAPATAPHCSLKNGESTCRPQVADGSQQPAESEQKGNAAQSLKVLACCTKNVENSAYAALWHVIIDVMRGKSCEKHVLRSAPEGPFPAKFEVSGANGRAF